MQQASRYEVAQAWAPRYAHAGKAEKGRLLDAFCELTGYTRTYALGLLRCPPPETRLPERRGRPARYGPAEVALLGRDRRYWW